MILLANADFAMSLTQGLILKLHNIQVALSVVELLRGRKIELNRSRVTVEKVAPLYRFIQKGTR
jgi:hypothetical protein